MNLRLEAEAEAERLENVDALAAIKAWLGRAFAYDDEHVLITAIRRDLVLALSDVEIKDILFAAVENERTPMLVLRQLLDADKGSEGMTRSTLKPR
jgi:hypothetical protein